MICLLKIYVLSVTFFHLFNHYFRAVVEDIPNSGTELKTTQLKSKLLNKQSCLHYKLPTFFTNILN